MVEPRVRTDGGDAVPSHVRADATAGNHRVAGASRPGRHRPTMSTNGRAFVPRTVSRP